MLQGYSDKMCKLHDQLYNDNKGTPERNVILPSIVVTTLDYGPGGSWFESRVGASIL